MGHEIDLKNYSFRTDLAIEVIEKSNIALENVVVVNNNIKVTNIKLDEKHGELISKEKGNYITIEFNDITDSDNLDDVTEVLVRELKKLLKALNITRDKFGLIIGLGNDKSTPDSLGPLTVKKIITTNHLYEINELDNNFMRIASFNPGVTGETGIETSEIIKSIVEKIKPDFVIVVDALASGSINRVNKTIQMTDTGISPGSGVGNSRKEISYKTLNVPVVAIGVPTVVDAATIVGDTIKYMHMHFSYMKENVDNPLHLLIPWTKRNYLNKNVKANSSDKRELLGLVGDLDDNEIKQLVLEVLTPIGYNLMVTPKEIDFLIDKLSEIISRGINLSLHEDI